MIMQIVVFNTPIRNLFGIVPLNIIQIIYPCIMVLLVVIIDEVTKPFMVKMFKD